MAKKVRRASRHERKKWYIHIRNVMREFPQCVYGNGRIFCRSSLNYYPWRTVSFTFFAKNSRQYYIVSVLTAAAKAWEQVEIQAMAEDETTTPWVFPDPEAEARVARVNARCQELGKLPQQVLLVTSLKRRYQGVWDVEVVRDLSGFTVEWMEEFVADFDKLMYQTSYGNVGNRFITVTPQDVEPWPED